MAALQDGHPAAACEVWALDEHRLGLKPVVRRVWTKRGERPCAFVHHRYRWLSLYGFVHPPSGRVLWYLMPFAGCDPNPPYACAPELVLKAPARAKPGSTFKVRVTAFDDAGKESPVEGATVTGATEPTDASGRTEVSLKRARSIVATKDGSVPSSPQAICVDEKVGLCAAKPGLRIVGSPDPGNAATASR